MNEQLMLHRDRHPAHCLRHSLPWVCIFALNYSAFFSFFKLPLVGVLHFIYLFVSEEIPLLHSQPMRFSWLCRPLPDGKGRYEI